MDASEARRIATTQLNYKDVNQYDKIMDKIKLVSANGPLYCWYYETISIRVKNKLEKMGYRFTSEAYHRNEYSIKINW